MVRIAAALVGVATAALLVLAPPASADSAAYLQELDARGVRYDIGAMDAIVQLGVQACNEIRGGTRLISVITNTANRIGAESREQLGHTDLLIVLTATKHLCPEFFGQTVMEAAREGWIVDPPKN